MEEHRELINEIKQITTQYQSEVCRDRKAWPKAIKSRITLLFEKGLRAKEISEHTGLAYYTVLRWRPKGMRGKPRGISAKPANKFKELAVVSATPVLASVTVAQKSPKPQSEPAPKILASVTVTTPQGFRVELPNYVLAVKFLRDLMKG